MHMTVLEKLLAHRDAFLAFLERRVGSRALAEDILQSAFLRSLDKAGDVRDEESAVAWFYRVLRNAIIDRYRQDASAQKALAAFAREMEGAVAAPEMKREICGCVAPLLQDLKPEYRDVLQAVELEERPVAEVAAQAGISANNATVRLHRARRALRRELLQACKGCADDGCVDCDCEPKRPAEEKIAQL
jgi:RNA polymerase sigma factor (sigma-70 family)